MKTKDVPPTDDRARKDGGKTTENKPIPSDQLKKTIRNAQDHTRDEPGS